MLVVIKMVTIYNFASFECFESSVAEDSGLVGCDALSLGMYFLTLQRIIMPSCGGSGRPRPRGLPSVISQETNFH